MQNTYIYQEYANDVKIHYVNTKHTTHNEAEE